jgi:uncharacterized protein YgbK (DUF1537 family)
VAPPTRPRAQPESELLAGLPDAWPNSLLPRLRRRGRDRTLVILDDDPTGTQTVRGVRVLLDPSTGDLVAALARRPRALFILTNSRGLSQAEAVALARRLGNRIRVASRRAARAVSIVSRSDSTLRGHFPAEVDALADGAGVAGAPVLFMPYLGEAGRITVADVHYLVRDGSAIPVAETEFARDAAFGYRDSNLLDWVAARLGADSRPVSSLSLATIRSEGQSGVTRTLVAAPARSIVIANAVVDRDAEVVAEGAADAERVRPILARTAAGYVRAAAAQPRQPSLGPRALRHRLGPGVVVVGSHVPSTTRQLEALLADPPIPLERIDVPVAEIKDARRAGRARSAITARATAALGSGIVPVIATSREVVPPAADDATGLRLARRISRLLGGVVRDLGPVPAWVVAKGGITSSDVASIGLGAREATVIGPLLPGVPVWRVRRGVRRSVLLVVFPGNVGDDDALRSAVLAMAASGSGTPPGTAVSRGAGGMVPRSNRAPRAAAS